MPNLPQKENFLRFLLQVKAIRFFIFTKMAKTVFLPKAKVAYFSDIEARLARKFTKTLQDY